MANYYDNLIKESYSNTISGQIEKINDAHDVIKNKAIELGLKIPKGKKLTSNSTGTTDLLLNSNHKLLDTAAAIDTIVVNNGSSVSLNAGNSYTVPVGYNKNSYTITASGLDNQTSGTATKPDILSGKTAWVNGSKITGTMPNYGGTSTEEKYTATSSFSNYNGKLAIQPVLGYYNDYSTITTTIPYYSGSNIEIPVTIITSSTGETIAQTSQKAFQPGYYNGIINITAVHKDSTNKVINIANAVPGYISSKEGSLSIPTGYDYFAPNASYEIQSGSISNITYSADEDTGKITFSGGVTTEGWVSNNVNLPTQYTPPSATFNVNQTTGVVTVNKSGWITKDDTIGGLSQGSATMTGPTKNTNTTALTVGNVSIPAGHYYMKLAKSSGYITSGTDGINLGLSTITHASLSSAGTSPTSITSKYWKIQTSQGYTPGNTVNLTVTNATLSNNIVIDDSGNCSLQITSSGWIDKQSKALTINATNQQYELTDSDLSDSDSKISIGADTNSFMTSLTIDMSKIVQQLSAI